MKLSYLIIALGLFVSQGAVAAPSGVYTINGKVGKLTTPAKAYVVYRVEKIMVVDSANLKNGVFQLKGKLTDPMKVRLVIDHKGVGLKNIKSPDFMELYVENTPINLSTNDSICKAKLSGSALNDEAQKLKNLLAPLEAQSKNLYAEYMVASKAKDDAQMDAIDKRSDELDAQLRVIRIAFVKANPESFVSLDAVKEIGGYAPDVAVVEPLFDGLSEKLRNTDAGKAYGKNIANLKLVAVGAVAPDFTQNAPDGTPVSLSSFKGKYVLVDFWASWCGPCRRENPNVVAAYNQFKDKNFTVFGVSLDNDKQAWLKAVEKDGLTWTHVSDVKGWQNGAAQLYHVRSIPANFLLDPNGKIIGKNLRGEELSAKLAEVLK